MRIHATTVAFPTDETAAAPVAHVRGVPPDVPRTEAAPFMSDQTYDDGRSRNLQALLKALAVRILELDAEGRLLDHAGELMRLIGDVRSELFHYEVRATYDTPEVAENRRIVSDAKQSDETTWEKTDWIPDDDRDPEW